MMKNYLVIALIYGLLISIVEINIWQYFFLPINLQMLILLLLISLAMYLILYWFKQLRKMIYTVQLLILGLNNFIGLCYIAFIGYHKIQINLFVFWLVWHSLILILLWLYHKYNKGE